MAPRNTRSTRRKREPSKSPDPYQDLVAEYVAAEASSPASDRQGAARVKKRRRVGEQITDDESARSVASEARFELPKSSLRQQVAYDDFDTEVTDDETDAEFEDALPTVHSQKKSNEQPIEDLKLILGGEQQVSTGSATARRKAFTAADRKLCLDIHKVHVLALIAHARSRNQWCNDPETQKALRGILPASVRKMFKDDTSQTQWQRSRSLKMGLEKAAETFREQFEISARGMSRAYWSDNPLDLSTHIANNLDLPITRDDFRVLAAQKSGSRDIGAQIFCTVLRAIGLDVRLICSLQPLPFRAIVKPETPAKPAPRIMPFHDNRSGMSHPPTSNQTLGVDPNAAPQGVRRFGSAAAVQQAKPTFVATPTTPKKKRIRESAYPVFWVEVFNTADQKWIPVDPLVLKLVDKPSKYEPPASDTDNNMSYIIAVDEDNFIRDVTRRYAQAYNAKTRRSRVEATRDGSKWWRRVIQRYRDPLPQDRDQLEDSELAAKEAREPMPRSIVEFKNHPYYALERHLKQNEVLHPKRQIGNVSAGSNKALEPIYRRQDVHLVRSSDAWFRSGRQVNINEEPLKFLEPKRSQGRRGKVDEDEEIDAEAPGTHAGTPLYAVYQTQQYSPPPIFNGIVPKNVYGNIDIYTPSMVPAGGVWINHPFARGAAKLLRVDWADAVTGFEFRARTGTAIIKGIVVASEFHEAVTETIKSLQYALEEEETSKREAQVLFAWKKFLIGLRIRKRIKGIHVEGEEQEREVAEVDDNSGSAYEEGDDDSEVGGGFLPNHDRDEIEEDITMIDPGLPDISEAEPMSKALEDALAPILSTWGKPLPPDIMDPNSEDLATSHNLSIPDYGEGGFLVDENIEQEFGGGFMPDATAEMSQAPTNDMQNPEPSPTNKHSSEMANEQQGSSLPEVKQIKIDDDGDQAQDKQAAMNEVVLKSSSHENISRFSVPQVGLDLDGDTQIGTNVAAEDRLKASPSRDNNSLELAPKLSRELSRTSESAGSLLSHDPEDEDAEPEWL